MLAWRRVRSVVVCLVLTATGCGAEQRVDGTFSEAEWDFLQTYRLDQLEPTTCRDMRCEAIARFGQQLFFDPRYSGAITRTSAVGVVDEIGKVACVTCHDPLHFFSDARLDNTRSYGADITNRNTPGLVDVASRTTFTWTGKADLLEDVLAKAAFGPAAMNANEMALVTVVAGHYQAIYDDVFRGMPDQIFGNAALAIATYERQLVSGPAPFDRYLAGDVDAIDASAKRGAKLFIGTAACSECHRGPLFTDDAFHVTGVDQGGDLDHGRFEVTMDPTDDGRFRTPTLRNVAKTAPYMHAGQRATLGDVIDFYRWGGDRGGFAGVRDPRIIPLDIDDQDAHDLEAFLLTLTGTPVDAAWTACPWNPCEVPQ